MRSRYGHSKAFIAEFATTLIFLCHQQELPQMGLSIHQLPKRNGSRAKGVIAVKQKAFGKGISQRHKLVTETEEAIEDSIIYLYHPPI
ncbi:hypothetical protein FF1_005324 [Malus domestica]